MTETPLISIIVPVYNVEFWLPKCIRSLTEQTYKNIEIILIDDGSKDKSGRICDSFAKKDSRIKVVHKENGGVSSARNCGIEISRGEYINFVDADDWLPKDSIEILHNEFTNNDIQISIGNLRMVSKFNKKNITVYEERIIDFNDPDKLFQCLYEECRLGGLLGKLFLSSIIKENNLTLKTNMKFGEDAWFLLECFKHCDAISLIKHEVYFYNRLVSDSAILKYYPKLTEWMLLLSKSRYDWVKEKGESYKNGSLYITQNALIEFEYIINSTYQKNSDKEQVIEIYRNAYDSFCEFINPTDITGNTQEGRIFDELIVPYRETKDFEGLYEHISGKNPRVSNSLKRQIKNRLVCTYLSLKRLLYRYTFI